MNEKKSHAVGYCRPPQHTRFTPGVSGNPRGRPKFNLSFDAELADELSEVVGDGDRAVTNKRAIVKKVIATAIRDARIGFAVMAHCQQECRHHDEEPPGPGAGVDDDAFVEGLVDDKPQAIEDRCNAISTPSPDKPTK